jgi:hypothetical protein
VDWLKEGHHKNNIVITGLEERGSKDTLTGNSHAEVLQQIMGDGYSR